MKQSNILSHSDGSPCFAAACVARARLWSSAEEVRPRSDRAVIMVHNFMLMNHDSQRQCIVT